MRLDFFQRPPDRDLSISDLLTARQSGAVQNLKDRRLDLYQVAWKKN